MINDNDNIENVGSPPSSTAKADEREHTNSSVMNALIACNDDKAAEIRAL